MTYRPAKPIYPGSGRVSTEPIKVLLAEDDPVISDLVAKSLSRHGYKVCGVARTVSEAILLGQLHRPMLAVLDMRLAEGGLGTDAARGLRASGTTGILYATGSGAQLLTSDPVGEAWLAKPYRSADLLRSLEIVSEIVTKRTASPPFPNGFHMLPSALNKPRRATTVHVTPTGHILTIEIETAANPGKWSVYEDRDGMTVLIGRGQAAVDHAVGNPAATTAARRFCHRYDATEAIVLDSLKGIRGSIWNLSRKPMRSRFASLLALFPRAKRVRTPASPATGTRPARANK